MIKNILLPLMLLAVLFIGCYDVEVSTVINRDGSCIRAVVIDSSDNYTVYPLHFGGADSLIVNGLKDGVEYKAYFPTVAIMAQGIIAKNDTVPRLEIEPVLQKRFHWFNTRYRYQETYSPVFHCQHIPLESYFSPVEIEQLFTDPKETTEQDSVLDNKFELWIRENFFQEFYAQMKALAQSGKWDISIARLQASKEKLRTLFLQDILDPGFDTQKFTQQDYELLATTLQSNSVYSVQNELNGIIGEIINEIEWLSRIQVTDIENKVTMPGLILDTNAKTLEGNSVTWDIVPEHMWTAPYIMWVESRVVNVWAYIATIALVAGMAIALVIMLVRRGRN